LPRQPLFVGKPVLVVVDIQQSGAMPAAEVGITHMPGHADRVAKATRLIAAAREAGEERLVVAGYLGIAYTSERIYRDLDTAREYMEKAVTELTRFGNLPDLAMVLASIGGVELQRGNIDAARPWVQQALDVAVEAEDDYGAVGAQYTFGWLEILAGDTEAARRRFVAALDLVAESDALSVAQQVEGIGVAALAADPRRAVTLFGAASKLREEIETPVQLPWSIWLEPADSIHEPAKRLAALASARKPASSSISASSAPRRTDSSRASRLFP